jgi:hypothetical protein
MWLMHFHSSLIVTHSEKVCPLLKKRGKKRKERKKESSSLGTRCTLED